MVEKYNKNLLSRLIFISLLACRACICDHDMFNFRGLIINSIVLYWFSSFIVRVRQLILKNFHAQGNNKHAFIASYTTRKLGLLTEKNKKIKMLELHI